MTVLRNEILQEALRLAELGYRVFPCVPGEKRPLTPHGCLEATTDPQRIEAWWREHPDANLAVATDGLVVLDVDGADNGFFKEAPERQLDLVGAPMSLTPRGGSHHFFREPNGASVRNSAGKVGPKVDIRARGGYVLVPPSAVDGKRYRWADGCELDAGPASLPLAPAWLMAALQQPEGSGAGRYAKQPTAEPVPERIREGGRHDRLVSIAGTMRRRGLDAQEILSALIMINARRCEPPLDEAEVAAIASSVAEYRPESVSGALTDLGNAERLEQRWSESLLFCHSTGRWLVWDGRRWKPDDDGAPARYAGVCAREMLQYCKDDAHKEARAKFARQSESRSKIDSALALAQSRPGLVVQVAQLDADPVQINVLNGTLDLRTGELRRHDPKDRITRIAPVSYDPTALCPRFDAFIEEIFAGDRELIECVQRLLGMCLTADIGEQVLPIFYGSGANGKSVLIETVMFVMGDYADIAPPALLEDRGKDEHPTEIADLLGKRLIIGSETEEGSRLKLQLVKRLTGDRVLKGRFMRQDYFSFQRTHKTVLVTNNLPRVTEDSEAVWRRVFLVPFNVTIPPEKRDPKLAETLRSETPGILAWLVRGCREWQARGLGLPAAVLGATSSYRADEDLVGKFLIEKCALEELVQGRAAETFTAWKPLFAEYTKWCGENQTRPLDPGRLGHALDRRGLRSETRRVNGKPAKGRAGVALLSALAEQLPHSEQRAEDLPI